MKGKFGGQNRDDLDNEISKLKSVY